MNVVSLFVLFSCQTYEGSFSAVPGTEGHGGYAFCAFASLLLLKKQDLCDVDKLLVRVPFFINNYFFHVHSQKWACHRQMPLEGGFQV